MMRHSNVCVYLSIYKTMSLQNIHDDAVFSGTYFPKSLPNISFWLPWRPRDNVALICSDSEIGQKTEIKNMSLIIS